MERSAREKDLTSSVLSNVPCSVQVQLEHKRYSFYEQGKYLPFSPRAAFDSIAGNLLQPPRVVHGPGP